MRIRLNTQPREPREPYGALWDGMVDLHSVWPTIQGEGPFAGHPAVFVRLAGCNLQCPMCDTDYTSNRWPVTADTLLEKISTATRPGWKLPKLVVITGGEPFRQTQALHDVVGRLIMNGFHVQIETNGSLAPHWSWTIREQQYCSIVCSPKTSHIHERMKPIITHLKYVGEAGNLDEMDGLPVSVLGNGVRVARPWDKSMLVYLQPMDGVYELESGMSNEKNIAACVESCQKHGYIYCHQIHKAIGLP